MAENAFPLLSLGLYMLYSYKLQPYTSIGVFHFTRISNEWFGWPPCRLKKVNFFPASDWISFMISDDFTSRPANNELHPRNLTWNPKMKVWKMFFLFTWLILRFHDNLPGCINLCCKKNPLHLTTKKHLLASHLGPESCRNYMMISMHTVSLSQDENLRRHISFLKRTPTRLKLGGAYQSYHCGTPCWFPCFFQCQDEVDQHVYQA